MTNTAVQHPTTGIDSVLFGAYPNGLAWHAVHHDGLETPLPPGKPRHPQPVPTLPADFFAMPAN